MMRSILGGVVACAVLATGCSCGDDDDDDTTCVTSAETGTVHVTVTAPAGAPLDVDLLASDGTTVGVTEEGDFDLPAGTATVEARRTRSAGPIVGTVYVATADVSALCVRSGATTEVAITVTADPASNRLWVVDGQGTQVLGLPADDLEASGEPGTAAVLSGQFTNPSGPAFGPDGRLWLTDAAHIVAYSNADLSAGGTDVSPSVTLGGAAIDDGSVPGVKELAFDADGALWVAHVAGSRVMKFEPIDLQASGEPTASVTITGPHADGAAALAFDADGNLWVGGAFEGAAMFSADRLTADTSAAADAVVTGATPGPVIGPLGTAAALAFDADGNLWAAHFGPSVIARYTPADVAAGDVTPEIQITVPVDVLLTDLAIDEAGGIWLTGAQGRVERLAPEQLVATTEVVQPETILQPAGLSYSDALAFYPPSAALPVAFVPGAR